MTYEELSAYPALPMANILSITADSLTYLDGQGLEQTIDLAACRANWAAYIHAHLDKFSHYDGSPVSPIDPAESRCVGARNWFDLQPFYIFFTDPLVKFEITPKKRFLDRFIPNWRQRYYPSFRQVENQLHAVNLCTYDLG